MENSDSEHCLLKTEENAAGRHQGIMAYRVRLDHREAGSVGLEGTLSF